MLDFLWSGGLDGGCCVGDGGAGFLGAVAVYCEGDFAVAVGGFGGFLVVDGEVFDGLIDGEFLVEVLDFKAFKELEDSVRVVKVVMDLMEKNKD